MTPTFAFWALLLVLVYCAWQLTQISRLARGCYVELSTARWENGQAARANQQQPSLSPLAGKGENLLK
jgi:hypothetical protein